MRTSWMLGLISVLTGCAHVEAVPTKACGAWKDKPELAAAGRDLIVGLGTADVAGADPVASARQKALAAIVEQLRMQVPPAQAAMSIDGVESLDACRSGDTLFAAYGLDRAKFVQRSLERINDLSADVTRLENKARTAEDEHRYLDSASVYNEAAAQAQTVDELVSLVRTVGKQSHVVSAATPATELTRMAVTAASKATVLVKVVPEQGTEVLRKLAMSCVTYAGLPAVERSDVPTATVTLDVTLEQPADAPTGLYLVEGSLSASIRNSDGTTASASAGASVKGAGGTAQLATTDAVRRLAKEKVNGVLDALFKSTPWKLKSCGDRK